MEANFIGYFFQELAPYLKGKRIQKVYVPLQGICTFQFGGQKNLILSYLAKHEALFLSASKPENPFQPPALAQWLRKRVKNCKIEALLSDWPHRRLALKLASDRDKWLILDLRKGPSLLTELPADFAKTPSWPSLKDILEEKKIEIWRSFPQLTPQLRRTLSLLPANEGQELLISLQKGSLDKFYLYNFSHVQHLLPWKLPDSLQDQGNFQIYDSALEAAEVYGWNRIKALLSKRKEAEKEQKRIEKKIRRNLRHIDEDAVRLQNLVEEKDKAKLLQANLYQLEYDKKVSEVVVPDFEGKRRVLSLNPEITILENMQKSFRLAAKGDRGLEHIRSRKSELEKQLAEVQKGNLPETKLVQSAAAKKGRKSNKETARFKGIDLHVFKSSDGFTILRGKNKKANHLLLSQAARAHDLWFHAQDSPGAHVVLRLDYENQDVPGQSKIEAAVLAGLASQQSGAGKASVLSARIKHVRKIKGADLGQVRIDQVEESFSVNLDKELENRLLFGS